jgi:inorganic pyrophosphatase
MILKQLFGRVSKASGGYTRKQAFQSTITSFQIPAEEQKYGALNTKPYAVNSLGSPHYRVFLRDSANEESSYWHHVPLIPSVGYNPTKEHFRRGTYFNYVNEIPKDSTAKLEVATGEPWNPIKQDVKKGKLRHYHTPSLVNYGMLPQTWENPDFEDNITGYAGDNDPVDVCELGSRVAEVGEVYQVKILGALGMIDEGEMDWKFLGLAKDDPLADKIHDLETLEEYMPGRVAEIVQWFKVYKIPDGKPENEFAFDDKPIPEGDALDVLASLHEDYFDLITETVNEGDNKHGHWVNKDDYQIEE